MIFTSGFVEISFKYTMTLCVFIFAIILFSITNNTVDSFGIIDTENKSDQDFARLMLLGDVLEHL